MSITDETLNRRTGDRECGFLRSVRASANTTADPLPVSQRPAQMPPIPRHPARVMISIRPSKLHFEESKHLVFRDRLGRCNRSHIVLNCHEILRPQKGPCKTRANHTIAVSWTLIITPYHTLLLTSADALAELPGLSLDDASLPLNCYRPRMGA